jgi:hypothetical protein
VLAVLWPLRRFFDPRFKGLADQLEVTHEDLAGRVDIARDQALERDVRLREFLRELDHLVRGEMQYASDATTLMGEAMANLEQLSQETLGLVRAIRPKPNEDTAAYLARLAEGTVEEIDDPLAHLLNHANSRRGFAAQVGLWFNPPVSLLYKEAAVSVGEVNERVVELPYALRALGRVNPPGIVLDVGAGESLLSLYLASLGYDVTALDPRPYPFSHAHLESVAAELQSWESDRRFSAVLCLSTIAQIADAEEGRADLLAMEWLRQHTDPGALLVLTAPFGVADVESVPRSYDHAELEKLLDGWTIEDLTIARREGKSAWLTNRDASDEGDPEAVALVTAVRAG